MQPIPVPHALEPERLVALTGRLDASSVGDVRASLYRAIDQSSAPVVIDLSAVHTIDATGLGMLIGAQRRADAAGRSVVLRGVPARVTRLLRATRLDRVLRVEAPAGLSV